MDQCVCVCLCVCTSRPLQVCLSAGVLLLLCVIWLRCFLHINDLSKSMYVFISVCASICIWMGLHGVCRSVSLCGLCVPPVRWMPSWGLILITVSAFVPVKGSLIQQQNHKLGTRRPGSLLMGSVSEQSLLNHSMPQFLLPAFYLTETVDTHSLLLYRHNAMPYMNGSI